MNMQRTITAFAAVAVTGLAISLAVASAPARAATPIAQDLLAGIAVAAVVFVHLAPALLRSAPRAVLWPAWAVALAAALWAHASFLSATATDAGAARQAASPAAAAAAAQRAAVEQALSQIKARPTAAIARQLSWTKDQDRAAALRVELQEARRADDLRQQLIVLAGTATAAAAAPAADPLTVAVASALDVSPGAVTLTVSLLLSILLEMFGMLLWREVAAVRGGASSVQHIAPASAPQAQAAVQNIVQVTVQQPAPAAAQHVQPDAPEAVQTEQAQTAPLLSAAVSDDLQRLRAAVSRGECKPTLASIRQYMRCGQQRAVDLRAALLDE